MLDRSTSSVARVDREEVVHSGTNSTLTRPQLPILRGVCGLGATEMVKEACGFLTSTLATWSSSSPPLPLKAVNWSLWSSWSSLRLNIDHMCV